MELKVIAYLLERELRQVMANSSFLRKRAKPNAAEIIPDMLADSAQEILDSEHKEK